MSIRLVNSAALLTDSNSVIGVGQDKASVAFSLRINGPLPLASSGWAGGAAILAMRSGGSGFSVSVASVDATTQTMNVRFYWKASNGTTVNAYAKMSPGIVYVIAMTYDKDAPASQALYVNGARYPMTPAQPASLDATSTYLQIGAILFGGTPARDFSTERWMWWNGYALSLDDVLAIIDGTGDPTNIGTSAPWRGFWKLDGAPGGTPANGDAALKNSAGDSTLPMKTSVNGSIAGSLLAYGDAMPFISQADYDAPIVCSSGRSIRVRTVDPDGGDLRVTGFGAADPAVRINGGSAITLDKHFSETHYGALYFLPGGYRIAPGDSVTFSAEDGFLVTGLGTAPGCTDLACVNKSGVPLYGDQPRTMLAGMNYTTPGATYWSYYQGPSNWAWRILADITPTSTGFREDGTYKVNQGGTYIVLTPTADQIDDRGYPMPLGKWLVSYIPKDAGRATNVSLATLTPGTLEELTAYGNSGSAAGDRVYKVFDVKENPDYPNTLVGDVDATTTSIPLANMTNLVGRSIYTNVAPLWLKIDDEYMTIEAVNTTTKVATVTRAVYGSTAASHASGTPCVARYCLDSPSLRVAISGPGGEPNYSDLVIYGPEEWTPPESPRQLVDGDVDVSLAAQLRPTKFVRDSMVHNGITRHMDSTMGILHQIAEPEYMRQIADKYWGFDAKFIQDFRITDLKPFNPEATPYFYVHHPTWTGAETYSATLADAIDESQTTITISDAATAKIVEGSRLFIGSEQLRVTAIDGTTATVVRGCMGTTAASHAAGTITVGWRVPLSSASQYQGPNKVAIELTTDRPHRLRSGMWTADPVKTDMNPLARGTVTLAANSVVDSQTITIAADDWTYIKPGLYIQFGTDSPVRIATANPDTGVCTLDQKIATARTSGTTGQTMASGVWCKSTDGTTHAWSTKRGAFGAFYVLGPDKLLVLTSAKLGDNVGVVDGDQTWDQTPAGSGSADQSMYHWKTPIQMYPYEYSALVSALSPGCVHWLNIPTTASDDTVYDIATRIRDNLPSGAGHSVVVELGNEVWNAFFPFLTLYQNLASLVGVDLANWADTWILRTQAVTRIIKDVFAETGHDAEILLSLPYQTGAVAYPLSRARALGVDVDVVSTAPYYGPVYTTTSASTCEAIDDDQCVDFWVYDYECNAATGTGFILRTVDLVSRRNHEALTGRPLKFYTYEGGFSSMLPVPPNGTNDKTVYAHGIERNIDLSYNPTCYFASQDRMSVDQRWGQDGLCYFNHCQNPAPLTRGKGSYHEMWGLTPCHGQPAGRGDGSDGKADNRLTLATPGKANTKGPLVNIATANVSVRLQSVLDWNKAYASKNDPPTDPDPDPDPKPPTDPKPYPIPPTGIGTIVPARRFLPLPRVR